MLSVYQQMEADGKIGPLLPPGPDGMRQPRPTPDYPKMLRPPRYERQLKEEPGPGGSIIKQYHYVEVAKAVVVHSKREEVAFLATGEAGAPEAPFDQGEENQALRGENAELRRRLERLEALLLADKFNAADAVAVAATKDVTPPTIVATTETALDSLKTLGGTKDG